MSIAAAPKAAKAPSKKINPQKNNEIIPQKNYEITPQKMTKWINIKDEMNGDTHWHLKNWGI